MKTFKNIAARFGGLLLIVCMAIGCTLSFSSCSTEEDELDDDGHRAFSKAFDFSVTRVERVGSVLIMDFTIRNKSGKDIQNFNIDPGDAEDSQGQTNSHVDVRFGNGEYSYSREVTFAKGETLSGSFRVRYFDDSNSARTVDIGFRCRADEANIDPNEYVTTGNKSITDNRVFSNGIQTNDLNLNYELVKTRQDGTDVYVTFRLTNNTGVVLRNFELSSAEARDQNGTTYHHTYIVAGDGTDYSWGVTTDINSGASQNYTLKISYVNIKVSKMSVNVGVTSPSYVIADDMVRILTVPVPYQNGSIEDPDTPPTPEAKLLKGIGNKVAFKYDSEGRLVRLGYNGNDNNVIFSYNPFSIAFGQSSSTASDFVYGSNGYVTGFKGKSSTSTYEQTVKYDSDGHIIAFSQEWYSNGVHSSTVDVVIKWTNGNIANYESVVYRPDGTVYSQEIGIPMYGGIENKANQISLSQVFLVGDLIYYEATGVFGKNCSRLLPDAITVTKYKNGAVESTETTTYSYEFNADRTICKETENGTSYIYSYY